MLVIEHDGYYPTQLNLQAYGGDTTRLVLDFINRNPDTEVEEPVDLSDKTFSADVKVNTNHSSPAITSFVCYDGSDPGRLIVELSAQASRTLNDHASTTFVYDLQFITTEGEIQTVLYGNLVIKDEVTRVPAA